MRRLTFAVRLGALLLFCVADLLYRCENLADGCCCLLVLWVQMPLDKGENNAIHFSALGFLVMGTRGSSLLAASSMGTEK